MLSYKSKQRPPNNAVFHTLQNRVQFILSANIGLCAENLLCTPSILSSANIISCIILLLLWHCYDSAKWARRYIVAHLLGITPKLFSLV